MPETSIIIRTFNEEKHLGNLLRTIAEQDYRDYEIIIVDAGSTDRTLEIAAKFPVKIVEIESRDFTFGYALNVGCKEARGKYLVVASAHVLPVDNEWLSHLVAPFSNERTAKVYGRQLGHQTSKFSEQRDFKRIFGTEPIETSVPLDYVNHANAALRRELWEKRHFDEYLFGLEDVEWAKYITGEGYLIQYEPKAAVYHIHGERWGQVFNRYRREAIAASRIGLKQPPQGRTGLGRLLINLSLDFFASFPNWSLSRLEEILRFRYYQWKGSRQGWLYDKNLDLVSKRRELFYPAASQAVVVRDRNRAELEELPLPEMRPGDVLIKVAYVGICRTDLEVYDGTLGYYKDGTARYPIVPGHEFSGTIVKIGANSRFQERMKLGQRVVGECIISKGEGSKRREIGVVNHNGAYSQYVVVPGNLIHKIPEGMDVKTAVLAEPLSVVMRGLGRIESKLTPESKIAVIGAGTIGNFCTQVLSLDGHKVRVFDRRKERLNLLRGSAEGVSESLNRLGGFDIIIEATGSKDVLEQVLRESRVDGMILLLGFPYGEINFNFEDLVAREKNIIGSVGAGWDDFVKALKLLPKMNTAPFTETVLPLEDFKKAWKLLRSSKYIKIILRPNPIEDEQIVLDHELLIYE